MSQTPRDPHTIAEDHPYAKAAAQLNQLLRRGHSFSGHERNRCFLNLEGHSFANASAVSGIDFPDDGRAVAKCDWDFDGDLDLWIANRTAPQVRFMRNEIGARQRSVTFRLKGVQSNRDAIGAVVKLGLNGDRHQLVQAVRGGEGFLAQNSKEVHFGLGEHKVTSVEVRWPSGSTEKFSLPARLGTHYVVVEGSGQLTAWTPPPSQPLTAVAMRPLPTPTLEMGSLLTESVVMPPLRYTSKDGRLVDLSQPSGHPRVINLWASWCQPCLVELSEWARHQDRFAAANASVTAICVDGLAGQGEVDSAFELLQEEQIPFAMGAATETLVEVLQQMHNLIYDHYRPLPVPTTLVLNGDGHLAAIYKGTVDADHLLADLQQIVKDENPGLTVLPFPGRWIGNPRPLNVSMLATRLWDNGLQAEAIEVVDRMTKPQWREHQVNARLSLASRMKRNGDRSAAMEQLRRGYTTDPDHVDLNMQLATELAEQGKLPQAIERLEHAIDRSPTDRADLYSNLSAALRRAGRTDEAVDKLRKAIEIDAETTAAYFNLGLVFAKRGSFDEAARQFARAAQLDQANVIYRINLAMSLANQQQFDRASAELSKVLEIDPDDLTARISLAEVHAQAGKLEEAITQFREVVRRQPKASRIWFRLGQVSERQGNFRHALQAYRTVDRLTPGDPRVLTRMAWVLATTPQASLRDGSRAVRLAEDAAQRTQRRQPIVLDALAAAYAEVGRFDDAVSIVGEAIALLQPDADESYLKELVHRQQLYRQQQRFRPVATPD